MIPQLASCAVLHVKLVISPRKEHVLRPTFKLRALTRCYDRGCMIVATLARISLIARRLSNDCKRSYCLTASPQTSEATTATPDYYRCLLLRLLISLSLDHHHRREMIELPRWHHGEVEIISPSTTHTGKEHHAACHPNFTGSRGCRLPERDTSTKSVEFVPHPPSGN
jgi:hypothetical protein